jgi:predicted ABC-type transport system involved in lysophospholipase L1 biosynthesis ATPase subunit
MTAPLVKLRGVSKGFPSTTGATSVLEGVDLQIEPGQKVSLVGPSGSGKSTLLSLIAGLFPPDAGCVEFDGVPMSSLDDDGRTALRATQIGIALQSENLIPFLTVLENVELALGFGGHRSGKTRARELLNRMGVGHRANHLPRQVSGGEAQRVALAVAIANKPRLLLADEMVTQLDAFTANAVVSDIFRTDMAVFFVTHDTELADQADVRLRLRNRQVVTR